VLGPLLFLAYINDMPETIIHSETRLFADDTILFRAINGTIDSQLLQEDLTALENWENGWQMSFNPSTAKSGVSECMMVSGISLR
jgi:hypothetical protein